MREATAEAAYAAGDWSTALTEYRALHRMTGSDEYLPVLADCERALGRPREALTLARKAATAGLDADSWLEMVMVEAGARDDLGQRAEGIRVLRQAIATRRGARLSQARLRFALAELLIKEGDNDQAIDLFGQVEKLDPANELDAGDRLLALGATSAHLADGIDVIAFDDSEDDVQDDESRSHESGDDEDDDSEDDDSEDDDTEDDDTEQEDSEDDDFEDNSEEDESDDAHSDEDESHDGDDLDGDSETSQSDEDVTDRQSADDTDRGSADGDSEDDADQDDQKADESQ